MAKVYWRSMRKSVSISVPMIIVAFAARWLYEPSCECGFTFDDHLGVVNNADVDTTRYM